MKAINQVLQSELVRLCAKKQWEVEQWQPGENAIAVMRATLQLVQASKVPLAEMLADTPQARTLRSAIVEMSLPIYEAGAAINLRRSLLQSLKLAPPMPEKGERKADALVDKV